MFRVFEGQTADQVWQKAASAFCNEKGIASQESRAGQTLEILHSAISITDPVQRWVTSRHPSINPAFAIAEVVWLIAGRNDAAFLNYFNRQLPKYAGNVERYHGSYGFRLRHHFGLDQLDRAYQVLKSKPYTRQVVLQIWDGSVDMPDDFGKEAAPDIPCNIASILKVRNGKLEWMQILRSNDLFRGLPYNFIQFTTLQEIIAGWLDLEVGQYNQISNSLHVYHTDLEKIETFSPRLMSANTDTLLYSKKESDRYFKELEVTIEKIINQDISADVLSSIVDESNLPEAFRNMLCVLCAEGVRRRQRPFIVGEIMTSCTNLLYKELFNCWIDSLELANVKDSSSHKITRDRL